mmetsp:Transcript_34030/g.82516  ORF Transcript_34030/g.82516 Transcript_34030/m.82516 type:complete len:97 (-) Transcript_34030:1511-1801(-)
MKSLWHRQIKVRFQVEITEKSPYYPLIFQCHLARDNNESLEQCRRFGVSSRLLHKRHCPEKRSPEERTPASRKRNLVSNAKFVEIKPTSILYDPRY